MSFLLFYAFLSTKFPKLSDSLTRQPEQYFFERPEAANITYLSGGMIIRVFRTATNHAI